MAHTIFFPQAPPKTKLQGHPAIFLGDVKMADVQRTLDQEGIEVTVSLSWF